MPKSKIKIVSSWTRPGGGTVAHINLTNLLNDNGYDCTFYGPHDWHLNKCNADTLDKCILDADDILISHFIQVPQEVEVKKHILYCHEKDIFPLKNVPLNQYDLIVYVSNAQRAWQGVNYPYMIIPPVVNRVEWEDPKNNIAGVIGSIDRNKQTHQAVMQAIKDKYDKVLLFGEVNDSRYYNESVKRLVERGQAVLMGHEDDRKAMYGQISAVYHASLSETFGLVEAECRLSGIPFVGKSTANYNEPLEILSLWTKALQ